MIELGVYKIFILEWKCLRIVADFWVCNLYMFQFQIICFYRNYRFPFALTYRFCRYWTRKSLNLHWKGKQLAVTKKTVRFRKILLHKIRWIIFGKMTCFERMFLDAVDCYYAVYEPVLSELPIHVQLVLG